jgi:ubiquitin C-terminal hydrolase
MQGLFSCKSFRNKILNIKQIYDETSLLASLNELFFIIESKKKKAGVIDSKKFVLCVKRNNQEFNNEEHHDSHEFLIWLLDSLDDNLKKESKRNKIIEPVNSI